MLGRKFVSNFVQLRLRFFTNLLLQLSFFLSLLSFDLDAEKLKPSQVERIESLLQICEFIVPEHEESTLIVILPEADFIL